MTQEEKTIKLLTVQISVWTALCCLNEYLQEEGIKPGNQKKKPNKMIQDLLSANSKIENYVNKSMSNFNFKEGDYINQVSYRFEDLVKLSYANLKSDRTENVS